MMIHTPFVEPDCPINWSHPLNRGLLGRWQCIPNEGWQGGAIWRDLGRGGDHPIDGTLYNMECADWIGPKGRPGGYGALDFGGTDEYVDVSGLDAHLNGASKATLMMWVFRASVSTGAYFGRGTANAIRRFGFEWHGNVVYHINELGVNSYPSYTRTDLGWHHLAAVFDGSQTGNARWAGYFDGVRQTLGSGGSTPGGTIEASLTSGMAIGRFSNSGTGFSYDTHLRDDVRAYSIAMTAVEVMAAYQESRAGSPETLNWYRPHSSVIVAGTAATPWLYARRPAQLIGGGTGI